MWTVWLVLFAQCAPAASFKAQPSSDEGSSFATFAFEHPPDVIRGSTSESLYVEDSSATNLTDRAASSNLAAQARATPSHDAGTRDAQPGTPPSVAGYPPGWGPTGPIGATGPENHVFDGPMGAAMGGVAPAGAAMGGVAPAVGPVTGALGAGSGITQISAVGDPHLQNVHGERFDLMKLGKHVLVNIPRGDPAESALLRVEADVRRLGGQCADTYFRAMNITGAWVEAESGLDGIFIQARGAHDEHPEWMKFGEVDLKVVHGSTRHGLSYLNFYVKHLGHSGLAVGGLLGEDDHTEEATPSEACVERLSLVQSADGSAQDELVSVAEASFD